MDYKKEMLDDIQQQKQVDIGPIMEEAAPEAAKGARKLAGYLRTAAKGMELIAGVYENTSSVSALSKCLTEMRNSFLDFQSHMVNEHYDELEEFVKELQETEEMAIQE